MSNRVSGRHWGYVFGGSLTMHFADREEMYTARDAFYVPPGHTPTYAAGTEMVQYSATDELSLTIAAIMKNMEAMKGG